MQAWPGVMLPCMQPRDIVGELKGAAVMAKTARKAQAVEL